MRNWKWFLALLVLIFAVSGVVAWGVKWFSEYGGAAEAYEGVPKIEIGLNGTDLETIKNGDKETKYSGNTAVISSENGVESYDGVEIKGRGNSTWLQDKKPYQLKFEKSTNILGMNKAKKWVLLANRLDASQLRTDVGFKLAEMLGANYANRGRFAEVYFDGEYEGLYYVMPAVRIAKGVVNLKSDKGVLMEVDTLHRGVDEACYWSYLGYCLVLKDAVNKDHEVVMTAATEFMIDFDKLEKAAEARNFAAVAELADVDDLVKYFLVNEITINPDSHSTSFYWYKDGSDDKLHAGPVWDFDLSMANKVWAWPHIRDLTSVDSVMPKWTEIFDEKGYKENSDVEELFYMLVEMPEFKAEVKKMFQDKLLGREDELILTLKSSAALIHEAALRDGEKWGVDDYDAEVEELTEWLEQRYEFMEKMYGNGSGERKSVL